MKSYKDFLFIFLLILFIILSLADLIAVAHTIYFTFTHIHLTRMETIFDPNNYIIYKLLILAATYVVFKILSK